MGFQFVTVVSLSLLTVSEGEEAAAEPAISSDISVPDPTVTPYYEPHQAVVR